MPNPLLPPAPTAIVDAHGHALSGRFAGAPAQLDWAGLDGVQRHGRVWNHFHHKHWHYVALVTEQLFCGVAIVDIGWTNTAFAYAFGRREGRMLAEFSQDGLPGLGAHLNDCPAHGAASRFNFFGKRIEFRHQAHDDSYRLELACGDFTIEAQLQAHGAAPCLLALGEVAGGNVHATVKSPGLPVAGRVRAGGRSFELAGGVASFDHSNGFLARETVWRWASAHAPGLGFNLQAGYFGDQENALWLDGQVTALGAAQFDYDAAQPTAPWHIHTTDGLLDLEFVPEGCRAADKNLLVAASRYVQPFGRFSGWVKAHAGAAPRRVDGLSGVTEDHFSRW